MPKDLMEIGSLEELEQFLHAPEDPEQTDSDTQDSLPSDDDSTSDSESTTETEQAQESVQLSDEQVREYLLKMAPRDIISMHPGVQGTIGAITHKQAREIAAQELEQQRQRERALEEQAEEDEIIRIARENPDNQAAAISAERILRSRNQKANNETEEARSSKYGQMLHEEMEDIYRQPVIEELAQKMSDEQLAKLYWKNGQYRGFGQWAQGMLTTVMDFAREEARKEFESAQTNPKPSRTATSKPAQPQRRSEAVDLPANLGESNDDSTGTFRVGDIRKMPFSAYAKNRGAIRESIFGDD